MLVAWDHVNELIERYPARGIKGPMGTAQDMLDLLGGDESKLDDLECRVADYPVSYTHLTLPTICSV